MVWRGWERDPTTNPAAPDVLTAYEAATKGQLPTVDCYRAAVDAWRRVHPDQKLTYAAKQAVAVVLAVKEKSLLRVE